MKASIVVSVCLVAVAAGLTVLWNDRGVSIPSPASDVAVTPAAPTSSGRLDVTTRAVEEPRDPDVGSDQTARSPSEEGIDGRLAKRQQEMADAIYQFSGTWVIERLTGLGLAQSDSEVVARRYAADSAECAMAALKTEAAKQLITIDELLSRVAAAERTGGDPFEAVDRSSLEANAFPCEADALQRAGIPLDEEFDQIGQCIEQAISDADVSNRAAAIELCVQNAGATRP